jgi:hypothetical protein
MATVGMAAAQSRGLSQGLIGGIAGLGFAAGVILQNGVLMAGSPLPGAPLDEVARFYSDQGGRVMIATGWVAINAAFILTFLSVITSRLQESADSAVWGRVAYASGISLLTIFAIGASMQAVLVTRISELETNQAILGLLWAMHSGSFAMSMVALGVTLLALSIGALATPFVPGWTAKLGMLGGVLLLSGGAFAFNVIDGGPALFMGFAGFGMWVVWLITASIRMLRTEN